MVPAGHRLPLLPHHLLLSTKWQLPQSAAAPSMHLTTPTRCPQEPRKTCYQNKKRSFLPAVSQVWHVQQRMEPQPHIGTFNGANYQQATKLRQK